MKLKSTSIVFGLLARDCAESLRRNMQRLEEVGEAFADYHVLVYENDSKDGTTEMLKEWAGRNPRVLAICETMHEQTIPRRSAKVRYPLKSIHRIGRMAGFRNRVLDEVRARFAPDLFAFVDIDVEHFSPADVIAALEEVPADWGALFASGHFVFSTPDGKEVLPPLQYDTYAYVPEGVDPSQTGGWMVSHRFHNITAWTFDRRVRRNAYTPCLSAFNGIGFYRWEAIRDLRFRIAQTPELEAVGACFCEHVPFNSDIVAKGYRCYVSRRMEVTYYHKPLTPIRRFNYWLKTLKTRFLLSIFTYPYPAK